jgi:hypothetical protein
MNNSIFVIATDFGYAVPSLLCCAVLIALPLYTGLPGQQESLTAGAASVCFLYDGRTLLQSGNNSESLGKA